MGLVKFEVEIPNFEKELSINITIRRDGEVFYSTSSSTMENIDKKTQGDNNSVNSFGNSSKQNIVEDTKLNNEEPKKRKKTEKLEAKTEQSDIPQVRKRGNFMNAEF